MKKLFVSYARENLEQVRSLAEDLRALGHQVWFDQALTGGQSWWEQILANIRDCDGFVLALSGESLESQACKLEYGYGFDLGKNILPVLVTDGVSHDLLPPSLAAVHYVDYRKQDKHAAFALLRAVDSLSPTKALPDPLPQAPAIPLSYLASLREQIESSKALSFDEQTAIVFRIKERLRDEKRPEDAHGLLRRFREREDLFARVADEIDELLSRAGTGKDERAASVGSKRNRGALAKPEIPGAGAKSRAVKPWAREANPSAAKPSPGDEPLAVQSTTGAPVSGGAVLLPAIKVFLDRLRVSYGPMRRMAIVSQTGAEPLHTSDAVEILRKSAVGNAVVDIGVKLIRSAALDVGRITGSGAATTALLVEVVYRMGLDALRAGNNPTQLTKAIEAAAAACVQEINRMAKSCTDDQLVKIATAAARGDEAVGFIIGEAFRKVGKEGPVTIEEHVGLNDEVSVVEGMRFDRGYLSSCFVTDQEEQRAVLADAYVFLCEQKISQSRSLRPLLEEVARDGGTLLMIADDLDGEALRTLASPNSLELKICAVKAPGFGDRKSAMLADMAILTGATVVKKEGDLEKVRLSDLGRARRVEIDNGATIIIDAAGSRNEIKRRIAAIRAQIEESTSLYEREKLQERLSNIAGVAVIQIGGANDRERKERRDLTKRAMTAARSAVEEGVLPGGGIALVRAAEALSKISVPPSDQAGFDLVRRACQEPLRQIAMNAGRDPDEVLDAVLRKRGNYGFDAMTGKYGDVIAAGIVDSTKSRRLALQTGTAMGVNLLFSSLTL